MADPEPIGVEAEPPIIEFNDGLVIPTSQKLDQPYEFKDDFSSSDDNDNSSSDDDDNSSSDDEDEEEEEEEEEEEQSKHVDAFAKQDGFFNRHILGVTMVSGTHQVNACKRDLCSLVIMIAGPYCTPEALKGVQRQVSEVWTSLFITKLQTGGPLESIRASDIFPTEATPGVAALPPSESSSTAQPSGSGGDSEGLTPVAKTELVKSMIRATVGEQLIDINWEAVRLYRYESDGFQM